MVKRNKYSKEGIRRQSRSYSTVWIFPEGSEDEVNYFIPFELISSRIKVEIDNNVNKEKKDTRSALKWIKHRYEQVYKKIDTTVGDSVWFVIDVDKKKWIDIDNFHNCFINEQNTHVIISNPCFEVWLLYHYGVNPDFTKLCEPLKIQFRSIMKENNFPLYYLPRINDAEQLAKECDPNRNYYFPDSDSACYSKVYKLIEHIKANSTAEEFSAFLEKTLPKKLAEYRQQNTSKNSGN